MRSVKASRALAERRVALGGMSVGRGQRGLVVFAQGPDPPPGTAAECGRDRPSAASPFPPDSGCSRVRFWQGKVSAEPPWPFWPPHGVET